jgi:RHS repeat-associated protein
MFDGEVDMARMRGLLSGIACLLVLCAGLVSPTHATQHTTYFITNAQGTVVATADSQGNVTYTAAYRPYGKQQTGTPQTGPGYTGHVNDPDTGLVYMQARYYSQGSGRFISVDPGGLSPGHIYNFNDFAYAKNNPVVNVDPDGKQSVMVDVGTDPVILSEEQALLRPSPLTESIREGIRNPNPAPKMPSLRTPSERVADILRANGNKPVDPKLWRALTEQQRLPRDFDMSKLPNPHGVLPKILYNLMQLARLFVKGHINVVMLDPSGSSNSRSKRNDRQDRGNPNQNDQQGNDQSNGPMGRDSSGDGSSQGDSWIDRCARNPRCA